MKTIKQFLIDYSRDVISGEIVACEKHIWACERFLNDVSREGTREFSFLMCLMMKKPAGSFTGWLSLNIRKGLC